MTDAGELIERLCVAAGMIMEDTAEAALISSVTVSAEQRLAMLLEAGRDIAALSVAAAVIARRYSAAAS